ncbi:hypothetical protein [Natronosalvus caseinilyticus]|uniref:hypothetical protein n=1 Tax=Natronosalvus caseinilyticus TaxID=2953747 RepID=UPI0028AB13B8|nr:hypothetical protein [Natronosalvus caseinilyticus]
MSEHDGADDDSGEQGAESEDNDLGEQRDGRKREGPGGGPRRVVSNTSVDDILDSLNGTNAGDTRAQPDPSADSRERLEDETSLDEAEGEGTGAVEEEGTGAVEGSDREAETEQLETADENGRTAKTEQVPNDEPIPRPSSQDDLSSRVERGAVTGADVRAAEAGEGRERTPDIDEIDLSLDDLETSQASESATSGSTAASPSNRADDPSPSSDEADDRADSNGLLARLRNLFSQ